MRLLRGGPRWVAAYVVTALPGALFALLMLLFSAGGVSWHAQGAGGNFFLLHVLLVPLYLTLFLGSFARRTYPKDDATPARWRIPGPLIVLGGVIGLSFLVERLGDPPPESPEARRDLSTTGCRNSPRYMSMKSGSDYRVVVFDRFCGKEQPATVNVSVWRGIDAEGPGNAFIAQPTPGSDVSRLQVFATMGVGGAVGVAYDTSARVIKRDSVVDGATIRYSPLALDGR
jgi:hypothetical protein